MSELGRNEDLALVCEYDGCEEDCPKECSTCAIAIKTDGDAALKTDNLTSAIRLYKRALFLEPRFAEAWNNLANAYNMKDELHNAIEAFNKAIAIDDEYGKALFGKAMTLRKLGLLDEAMQLANQILDLYNNEQVIAFKHELLEQGVHDDKLNENINIVELANEKEESYVELPSHSFFTNLFETISFLKRYEKSECIELTMFALYSSLVVLFFMFSNSKATLEQQHTVIEEFRTLQENSFCNWLHENEFQIGDGAEILSHRIDTYFENKSQFHERTLYCLLECDPNFLCGKCNIEDISNWIIEDAQQKYSTIYKDVELATRKYCQENLNKFVIILLKKFKII